MTINRRSFLGLGGAGMAALLLSEGWPGWLTQHSRAVELALIPRGDQRLACISDLNASYGSTNYIETVHQGVKLLRDLRPDLVICAGDMVAGQKRGLSSQHLDAMWQSFHQQVLQPLRGDGLPFAASMGNHDASSSRNASGYVFALDRERAARFWRQQQQQLGINYHESSQFPFRFSFQQGNVFVVNLDASSAQIRAEDWQWADQQLSTPLARQAMLRLVIGHLPPYAISQGRDRAGEVLRNPERLLQLMKQHAVHLYISGHHHAWYPAQVGTTNLLSLGAMGNGPRRRLGDAQLSMQTLTLLDLFHRSGELVETTVALKSGQVISPDALPGSLQPSDGPMLKRRSSRSRLSS